MAQGWGPTTSRRRLRRKLRELREGKGYSYEEVRRAMEWSLSKIIRIESGGVSLSATDLRSLLGHYGVIDSREIDDMLELARVSRQRHWSSAYRMYASPAFLDFLGYEDDAACVKQFHPLVIPGLLQTKEYAHALIKGMRRRATTGEIDARVQLRLARQEHFFGGAEHPRLQVVVDEFALRRPVGGRGVMRRQLDHVLELSERPEIELAVISEDVGSHPGLLGAFSLLTFESDMDPQVVYLENAPDDVGLIEDENDVAAYRESFAAIVDISLRKRDAVAVLTKLRDLHEKIEKG
ncbi:DUF5753 domain-containing protein [Paractinoplanes toevensis]|uniref:Transcriptional regulator n=1 Tax=Paractinoplanes toevensis TaxID=571911 RepID=A0A919WD36_9ACTN|nr:DUF5753 domain-containing protein [Actinoplanes toevensis]GIM97938.1 transcriptional regulator [Actinoplanes toevensis]